MMTALSPAIPLPAPPRTPLVEGLVDTLRSERRLLDELIAIMERQRAAVAANDLLSLDDSTFDAQRVLLTLGEARKRRRTLTERLGCDVDTPARDLCESLGAQCTDALGHASRELEECARALSREVSVNRRVLNQGLAAGEEFMRIIAGASSRPPGYPDRQDAVAIAGTARLVNRQA